LSSYCNISSTDINFGTLKLNGVPNYSNGAIYVECSNKVSYNIAITFGHPDTTAPYYNGRPNDGKMTGAVSGDIIDYAITSTLNGSWSWGVASAVNGVGNGQVQTYTTYGVSQTGFAGHSLYPTSDTYSDSATVTLSY
jgi:spore coat protein U-like protein